MDTMNQLLPRKGRNTDTHNKLLKIPIHLYSRMVNEAGLKYGEVMGFILEAVQEKLDREGNSRAANKEAGRHEKSKRTV